ncbi:MAG: RNA 2',3'-cyclic phosphodiesterase [bacterium]|nr:RNA 2',3'-cyclic phosphodiesterase [bacterium]
MRTFIAIDLPQDVKDELKKAQETLSDVRLVKNFHLTLKFLGEITPEKVECVKNVLTKIEFKSFKVSLSNIGVFPNMKKPRVIWVGLKPENELIQLQKQIDEALKDEFEKDSFSPHLTLARVKFNKGEFSLNAKITEIPFEISEFKLKKSTLTREGPIYEDLCTQKAL